MVPLGVVCFARSMGELPTIARAAEAAGIDFLAFADSPALAHDPFVAAAVAAASTERLRVGVGVVNPRTRHPAVLANAGAALAAATPRGAVLGIGTGNSGVAPLGIGAATIADVERTVSEGRQFLARRAGQMDAGSVGRLTFTVAGSGPRILSLAGRVADAAWINVGTRDEDVAMAAEWLGDSRVERWLFCVGSVDDDRVKARDAVRGAAAALARYVLGGELRRGSVPADKADAVAELVRQYRYDEHLEPGANVNADLCERLGLTEYVVDRFAIAGSVAECADDVRRLAGAPIGLDGICVSLSASPDLVHELAGWGEILAAV